MFRIQIRHMHLWEIWDGIIQIIVFVVYSNLSTIRNILTEFVLKKKFITAGTLFFWFAAGFQRRTSVGAEIIDWSKHTVVKQT